MTISHHDYFAFIPKRCGFCNRLFWLEAYDTIHVLKGISNLRVVEKIKCKECKPVQNDIQQQLREKLYESDS